MLSSVLLVLLITVHDACLVPPVDGGDYFISNVQLLDHVTYPDSLLLTITRTDAKFVNYTTPSQWCKVMNVNSGSVSTSVTAVDDIYDCSIYDEYIRDSAVEDTDPMNTSVACFAIYNRTTAHCLITRHDTTTDIASVTYNDTNTSHCSSDPMDITTFTINTVNITFIVFPNNVVSVAFDDSAGTHSLYDVLEHDEWWSIWNLVRLSRTAPDVYANSNVMRIHWPYCACYCYSMNLFQIVTSSHSETEEVKLGLQMTELTDGGLLDDQQSRVIKWNAGYPDGVHVWDLSNGDASYFEPDLCDAYVSCSVSPCNGPISCTTVEDAQCVEDYCGGCVGRWYDDHEDVTTRCYNHTVYDSTTIIPIDLNSGDPGRSGITVIVAMGFMMLLH